MTISELFNIAIESWRTNRCNGTCIISSIINDKYIVLDALLRIYVKTPNANILIITSNFQERIELIEFLTHQEDEENNVEFKRLIDDKILRIFTVDYVERNGVNMTPYVTIVYHSDKLGKHLEELLIRTKFKLVVLNKRMTDVNDMNKLYSICPLLDAFKQNDLDELRVSTPVEDSWIGVDIPEDSEEYKLLEYYNDYIITSIRIFGSFDNIQQARVGNTLLNISANQICHQIAYENGWSEHLDMSVTLNVQLDELYNPSNLHERASQTYEIVRNRSKLLSDYEGKLNVILNIIEEHKDEKILIINKRGDFANIITDYLNSLSETTICGNYHDKIEPVPAVDLNGNPIYYKSGVQKGKRKQMCSQAQKTRNVQLFNEGKINILAANAAPDKDLNINVDVVIITSPLCDDIKSYMYRLGKVYYNNNVIKLYSLFVKNSIEQTKLQNKPLANNHTIIHKHENLENNENNYDFVLVD